MKEFSPELAEAITQSRIDILRQIEFVSIFFLNMEVFETDEAEKEQIKTAAVAFDGVKLFMLLNPEFMLKMTRKQRNYILIHEILHAFFEHIGRQIDNSYHQRLWNVATDYIINNFIESIKDETKILETPEGALIDPKFDGMTADQVYHKLLKDNDGDADKAANSHGGNRVGEGTGNNPAPFDAVDGSAMSQASKNNMKQEIAAGVAIAEGNKSMGSGMGNLLRRIKDILEPALPWGSILQEYVTRAASDTRTYNRLSRRTSGQIVFPSTTGDHIHAIFGSDSSGSMTQKDLTEAATELSGVINAFDSWTLEFVTCDSGINVVGNYDSEEGDDFSTINMKFEGGGGTDMAPIVKYSNDAEEVPSVLIVFTDGHIPEKSVIAAHEDIPTIFVVTSTGNKELNLGHGIDIVHMN